MKKQLATLLIAACTVTLFGCGKSDAVIINDTEDLTNAVYTNDYVSLAAYTGLSAEKKVYEVTQDAVDVAISDALAEYAEYETVDRASEDADWICTDLTVSVDGELYIDEDEYYILLGDEEFGDEFDQKLTGVSAGDELNFSLSYDKDYEDEDLAGHTADFSITIKQIEEEILPECTDEFVKENLGYENYDEFEAAMYDSVAADYEYESDYNLKEDLLQQVIDASRILQYTQEDYDAAYAEVEAFYSSYAEVFDMDLEEIYDIFEITEEDMKKDTLDMLSRHLVVNAIAENEKISISDEEYEAGLSYYMEENDYDSKEEFLNDYGEEALRRQLLEDAVLDLLAESAQITEVPATHED